MPLTTTETRPYAESTAAMARDTVGKFLKMMGTTLPRQLERSPVLADKVKAITRTWPFENQIHHYIAAGTRMAEVTFSHFSDVDAIAAVAAYTILMFMLDDQDISHDTGTEFFAQMLCGGTANEDTGPLGQLAKVLANMGHHFSPFGATIILSSTLRTLTGEMLCNPASSYSIAPRSKRFVDYQRSLTGDSEAFAAFIWCKADFPTETSYIHALPEIGFFMDHANDILSFYKEDLEGDTTSYIHARARVSGKSIHNTLIELVDEVVAAAEQVRKHLGEGRARNAWDKFEANYIWFHLDYPRYRLREVVDAEYYEVSLD